MPRSKERNEEIKSTTITKIKSAGLKLFSIKGLADTSIVDISELAGISTGLMYHYYKSKEDLYTELIKQALTESNAVVCEIAEMNISPGEKISLLVRKILGESMKDNNSAQFYVFMSQVLLNKSLPNRIKKYTKDAYVAYELLIEIIINGQRSGEIKEGDPQALATLFFSAIMGLCTYKVIMGRRFVAPDINWIDQILLITEN